MNVLVCLCCVVVVVVAGVAARPEARSEATGEPGAPDVTGNPTTNNPVSGDEAAAVQRRFPHAVLFGGTCGGTVIDARWILTAAHCTIFSGADYVVAGTGHTDDESGVQRLVKRLVVHPRFTVGPYWLRAEDYNITQDAVSLGGGVIGAMHIPEKWFPGAVDRCLNSHNIMHVLVVLAVYSMHQVTKRDLAWMSRVDCRAPLRTL